MDDLSLVLVEDQTSGRQPLGQPRLDMLRLLLAVAERDQVVGLCRALDYAEWCSVGAGEGVGHSGAVGITSIMI
jgi:hypothetical protein